MFECLISAFVDEFPWLRPKKILFTAFMCFVLFLLGIPCVMNGGIYILQLMDWYAAAFSLMIISLLECVVIAWVYGEERFSRDIEMMVGHRPHIWFRICWKYISPVVICFILLFTFTLATHAIVVVLAAAAEHPARVPRAHGADADRCAAHALWRRRQGR